MVFSACPAAAMVSTVSRSSETLSHDLLLFPASLVAIVQSGLVIQDQGGAFFGQNLSRGRLASWMRSHSDWARDVKLDLFHRWGIGAVKIACRGLSGGRRADFSHAMTQFRLHVVTKDVISASARRHSRGVSAS